MTSYLFNGQWTTDKNERKYRHMSIIPFPVCEYAAIHYIDERQLENISYFIDRRRPIIRKIEMKQNKQNERSFNKKE